jgi:3-hydroxybutyryl-CoA dehydrogenase
MWMVESTGMDPGEVDACMELGAGHPMGPPVLLDFVGLEVACGDPRRLYADSSEVAQPRRPDVEIIGEEELGWKSGVGF